MKQLCLCYLVTFILVEGAAQAPAGPRWLVTESQTEATKSFSAHLVVPALRGTDRVQISFLHPSDVSVKVKQVAASPQESITIKGPSSDTLIAIAVTPRSDSFKIASVLRYYQGNREKLEVALSPGFGFKEKSWTLSPILLAIITSFVGFISGISAHFIQKRRDRKDEIRKVEATFLTELCTELVTHKRMYTEVQTVKKVTESMYLPDRGYNTLLAPDGVVPLALYPKLKDYFENITDYYKEVKRFNFHVGKAFELKTESEHAILVKLAESQIGKLKTLQVPSDKTQTTK